jgi:hypothetical protein
MVTPNPGFSNGLSEVGREVGLDGAPQSSLKQFKKHHGFSGRRLASGKAHLSWRLRDGKGRPGVTFGRPAETAGANQDARQ